MRVVSIEFDRAEELEAVTVRLTAAEAAFITKFVALQTGEQDEAVMPGGSEASSHLYEGMTTSVFNRYHENGVDGWIEENQP